ncbi:hydroxymethylglutaryl-CoA lyase [Lipingzhangella halophila]|uniref:Hydroxymethylglutaryl-CoA lyase n=1 Tax=Lipingzhangella halophila TaxID=1783352 RepID=A0A7W7W2A1_9ACTN|nr:hydroxymethylglutaryl-CoA lyase [Lipingzhangella halophila]MBB4930450.1 hydroxymethylglutaryl-CoA lyase [Lipingzhangella halophila]
MRSVSLMEVAPRDGLQNEPAELSTRDKVELIERSIAAGVRRVEAVSFVNPKRVPRMADAEDVMAAVPRGAGVSYTGLVLNPRGMRRALEAAVDEVNAVVVVTETLSQRNQGCGVDEAVRNWAGIAAEARAAGVRTTVTLAAAFGCPFEGEVSAATVLDLAARTLESGPDEIALADTIGAGTPDQVETLLGGLAERAPGVPTRCHFHNTRNTGYANAVAALRYGVSTLDASLGGIGGCPFAPNATGNIASEDLLYTLSRMGVRTGVELEPLLESARWLGDRIGRETPGLLPRAGAFPN